VIFSMKVFDFDPAEYSDHFAEHGWVHIKQGQSPEFHVVLKDFVDTQFGAHRVEGATIGGQKQQALYEFPAEVDFPGELFDAVAATCGLNRGTMTLSERHIKAYDDNVPAEPAPHKDRFASQVSMGLSIAIPDNSYLVLYPWTDRGRTPFNISTHMRKELPLEERPENIVKGAKRLEVHDSDGDVIMFEGSAIWHVRHNAANARNLYLKLNDFNSDPLGEDPSTDQRRLETMKLVQSGDGGLVNARPVLARRFESVTEQYSRLWDHTRVAEIWDSPPVPLEDVDLKILQGVNGQSVESVTERLKGEGVDPAKVQESVKRLAERGVLDLLP
jgi:hypothetical protein